MKPLMLFTILFFASNLVSAPFDKNLSEAAIERTKHSVQYDGAYVSIKYPNGDVPGGTGVCTDVVIRSYRSLGIDLQQLVHEDMANHFMEYPSKRIWGMNRPDTNIDHRRVPNLQTFFRRHGEHLPISQSPDAYKVGDLVTWLLPGNLPHIGIVIDKIDPNSGNPIIVHNIGRGPEASDMLFSYDITGHFRFDPSIAIQSTQ
ncbi:MAG: DUF1287 domain-containing protein [Gammaproteobacteria bacterium]|nr:MAG: DUF1287 domain-containing protein [Gammaproteobacteria bacterium]